jgi:hypothetical protein
MEFQPNRRSVELSIVQERGRTPRACKVDRAAQFLIGDRLLTDVSAGNFLQAGRGQRTPRIARYGAMRSVTMAFDLVLLLFIADKLLDRDAGSTRKPGSMTKQNHATRLYPAMDGRI